jgi:hypothetical protein
MGTSASNSGPKRNTELLPTWAANPSDGNNGQDGDDGADEGNDNDGSETEASGSTDTNSSNPNQSEETPASHAPPITGNWGAAKGALSRYAKGTTGSSLKKAARSYVKTLGGSSKATKASGAGISTGGVFINFISGVSRNGYQETLRQYGLADCLGKSSEEVLAKIADRIAPIGSTNDEAIARNAVLISLDALYEKLLNEGKDIDALGSLDEQTLKNSVEEFVGTYIFKKWVYEVGLAIEKNELTEKEAISLEKEIKIFVRDEVRSALRDKDIIKLDLNAGEGKRIVENIFELAYSTIAK